MHQRKLERMTIMAKLACARKRLRVLAVGALAAGAIAAIPGTAQAEPVTPTAKGIAGGVFLGAEAVVFTEAIIGVRSTPAYLIGAGAGAVAGGVGGYFIEQAVDDGRIPAYLLAGGLALAIPALVVALDATRYMPSEGAREDKPVDLPPSDPGKPGGSSVLGAEPQPAAPAPSPAPTTPAPSTTPPPAPPPSGGGGGGTQAPRRAPISSTRSSTSATSLVAVNDGAVRVGVPIPEVRSVLGAVERARMGVENRGSEVRFPVVRVTF